MAIYHLDFALEVKITVANFSALSGHSVTTACHGKKLDNRIGNLREVSLSENLLNMLLPWKPNKDTSVASVSFCRNIYQTKIQGRNYYFSNPYEAFYWAMVCGKRHRS